MKENSITVCTVLVENSPQALPLGAACIASFLKAKTSSKVFLKTYNLDELKLNSFILQNEDTFNKNFENAIQKLTNELLKLNSKIYCFSLFVWNRKLLCKIAIELKKLLPNSVFIAGGPEVTANPKSFFPDLETSSSPFDFVVSGEGESATTQLINQILENGKEKIDEKIFYGKRENLLNLPSPYLDGTLDLSKYDGALWELARGCPFKCSYCYESKGEKIVDYFPLERIKDELKFFHQNKVNQIWVLDPTYNANKKRAIEILKFIAQNAPEIFFHFECRAEFIDYDLAKVFSKINCCLQIGLQSESESVLNLVHRNFNKKEFVKKIAILNELGIVFGFDLIYGLPGDTLSGFEKSIDFALSLYPNHLELFCLSVLPGTKLFDDAENLNLTFEKTPPYHIIKTDKFSKENLIKAEKLSKACNFFYSKGRAVPWFNSIVKFLKMRPTTFFYQFSEFLTSSKKINIIEENLHHTQIEQIQVEFINHILKNQNKEKYFNLISDIIKINGAFSRISGENEESIITLHYNIEDLLSEFSSDIQFFFNNSKQKKYRVQVFNSKHGIDFRIL